MSNTTETDLFTAADVVYSYTRAQALADGVLVACPADLAKEAGVRFHVAFTAGAWAATVGAGGTWCPDPGDGHGEVMELPAGQSATGRLWDVLNVLWWAIKRQAAGAAGDRIDFAVSVWDGRRHVNVSLYSLCGPGDNGEPVITILLPNED